MSLKSSRRADIIDRRTRVTWGRVIKANYSQVFFVFTAFFLMVLASYLSIGAIVRRQLIQGLDKVMLAAEANVRAGFSKSEAAMSQAAHIVQEMLDKGASQDELQAYIANTNEWIGSDDEWGVPLNGIYGYLRGEFMGGDRMGHDPAYKPQTRPWFDAAVRNPKGGKTTYTEPYLDARTGKVILSAVRNVYGQAGNYYGILAVDIDMTWFREFAISLKSSGGGYGLILNQYMVVVGHPRDEMVGRQLREAGEGYRQIHDALLERREISAMSIKDLDGVAAVVSFKPMFNGWHVGVVVPSSSYYRDVYYTAAILSILGLILMSKLSFLLLRLAAARMRSDEKNRSKSTFLALMSHEIRTPMNAVMGLSELGLETDDPAQAAEYFADIRSAGRTLLSIINDILDFSKIESGNLEMAAEPYMLASILNDIINITKARLSGKHVLFTAEVESALPNNLIGDETRLKQVLLNLLSNAVKYTDRGFIRLSVAGERRSEGLVNLKFEISDSGVGIKPEDMRHLFGDFVRLNSERNKTVEGTGLGLAIARRLCLAMGGDITAASVYGEGSVFTAAVTQRLKNDAHLAEVKEAKKISVLFYEDRPLYAKSVGWTLKDLGVESIQAASEENFLGKLYGGKYSFAFAAHETAVRAMDIIRRGRLRTGLAILAGLDETAPFHQGIPVIVMPAYAISVANVLNREKAAIGGGGRTLASFTAPEARVLLVDDVPTNLLVARGFLAKYGMIMDMCGSGEESIERVRENDYDIVFMDHMMPGLDGIEATALIRGMEKGRGLPIVALTANAVSGMREMFLRQGLDDFLSKPIDPLSLDEVLRKWIPKEKQRATVKAPEPANDAATETAAPFAIEGVDAETGLAQSGGTEADYREILEEFNRDAAARIGFLTVSQAEEEPKSFIMHTHSLKSSSASIGAMTLSEEAASLESAGRFGDLGLIRERIEGFRENLSRLMERIGAALAEKPGAAGRGQPEVIPPLRR